MTTHPMITSTTPDAARRRVTIPTAPLILVAWAAAGSVACLWVLTVTTGAALGLQGFTPSRAAGGALAAAVVALAASAAILALQPWRPRQMITWPVTWVVASFGRLALSIGGTLLLYSATPYRSASLWLAMILAYAAVLIGETQVYARVMRRLPLVDAAPSSSASE